jgi:hypothetical protein
MCANTTETGLVDRETGHPTPIRITPEIYKGSVVYDLSIGHHYVAHCRDAGLAARAQIKIEDALRMATGR